MGCSGARQPLDPSLWKERLMVLYLKILLIFLGGVLLDLLTTRYMRSIASGHRFTAALLSGVITLANFALWGSILHQAEMMGLAGAMAMAGGASVGTLLAFKHRTIG
jgi:hypothetical protein